MKRWRNKISYKLPIATSRGVVVVFGGIKVTKTRNYYADLHSGFYDSISSFRLWSLSEEWIMRLLCKHFSSDDKPFCHFALFIYIRTEIVEPASFQHSFVAQSKALSLIKDNFIIVCYPIVASLSDCQIWHLSNCIIASTRMGRSVSVFKWTRGESW